MLVPPAFCPAYIVRQALCHPIDAPGPRSRIAIFQLFGIEATSLTRFIRVCTGRQTKDTGRKYPTSLCLWRCCASDAGDALSAFTADMTMAILWLRSPVQVCGLTSTVVFLRQSDSGRSPRCSLRAKVNLRLRPLEPSETSPKANQATTLHPTVAHIHS